MTFMGTTISNNTNQSMLNFENSKVNALQKISNEVQKLTSQVNLIKEKILPLSPEMDNNYFFQLIDRISNIEQLAEFNLNDANTLIDIKFHTQNNIQELRKLTQTEWPLFLTKTKEIAYYIKSRIDYSNKEFNKYPNTIELYRLNEIKTQAKLAFNNLDIKLQKTISHGDRYAIIKDVSDKLNLLIEELETCIATVTLFDTRDKIIERTQRINIQFQDISFETQVNDAVSTVDEAYSLIKKQDSIEVKRKEIQIVVEKLKEIDMEIEKIYAVCDLKKAHDHLVKTAGELKDFELNISYEVKYAKFKFEDSTERLQEIENTPSPDGMGTAMQLCITKKGALASLARTLDQIYFKYGKHRINKYFKFFMLIKEREGCSELQLQNLWSKKDPLIRKLQKDFRTMTMKHMNSVIKNDLNITKIKMVNGAQASEYKWVIEQTIGKYIAAINQLKPD